MLTKNMKAHVMAQKPPSLVRKKSISTFVSTKPVMARVKNGKNEEQNLGLLLPKFRLKKKGVWFNVLGCKIKRREEMFLFEDTKNSF